MATRASLVQKCVRILGVSAAFNASVEEAVDEAITYLVRNWDFHKSLRYVSIGVTEGQRLITLPIDVKRVRFVQLQIGSAYYPLDGGMPDTFPVQQIGIPRKYWRDNQNQLFLDTPVHAAGNMEVRYYSKTGEGTTSGGGTVLASVWMPEDYPDAVLQRAIITVSPECRKPEVQAMYIPLWQDTVAQLGIEMSENEFSGTSAQMQYQPGQNPMQATAPSNKGGI